MLDSLCLLVLLCLAERQCRWRKARLGQFDEVRTALLIYESWEQYNPALRIAGCFICSSQVRALVTSP